MSDAHFLNQSLLSEWLNYETQLRRTKRKTSAENVHHLRIAIRRLEGVIALVRICFDEKRMEKLLKNLKKTRKKLGPLRELQVDSAILTNLDFKTTHLVKHLSQRIEKEKKESRHHLNSLEPLRQTKCLHRIAKRLNSFEETNSRVSVRRELLGAERKSLLILKASAKDVDPNDLMAIHGFRKRIKKFRYRNEFLPFLNISPLKEVQDELGLFLDKRFLSLRIQNDLRKKKTSHRSEAREIIHFLTSA